MIHEIIEPERFSYFAHRPYGDNWEMGKTAVGAGTPPSADEMIKAIEQMTWSEILDFAGRLEDLVQKIREQKVNEKHEKYERGY